MHPFRTALLVALMWSPTLAAAEETSVFVQGVVGYSSPVAGTQYMEGVGDAAARIGIRGGWTPLNVGAGSQLGFDITLDWRPTVGRYGEGAQELRAIAGPRLAFVNDRYMTFFRLAVGYHRLALGDTDYVTATGLAVEPGFGAALRRGSLLFGAEISVPLALHPEQRGDAYRDGYAGADIQALLSIGSQL